MNRRLAVAAFSLLMVLAASISNSVMDTLVSHYDRSVFSSLPPGTQTWLDPRVSFKNKWKDGERSHGDAFFLSSTVLSPLTDAWHFFKFLTIFCLILAILAPFTLIFPLRWYYWILVYAGVELFRGAIFELLYARLLIK